MLFTTEKPSNPRIVAYLVTLLSVGGMLNCPIPRALVRELGLVKRARMYVFRDEGRRLVLEPLEDYLAERVPVRRSRAR